MKICKRCKLAVECSASSESDFCLNYEPRPLTNADRIRSMSDEELAEFIASGVPKDVCKDRCGGDESFQCSECVLNWLREETT